MQGFQDKVIGMLVVCAGLTSVFVACGGGDKESVNDTGMMSSGGSAGANVGGNTGGTVVLPASCTAPGGCPAGYVCVPNMPPMFTEVVDESCAAQCTPPCEFAGPFMSMCVQDCRESCTTQQPSPDSDLTGTCQVDSSPGGTGGITGTPLPQGGSSGGGTGGMGGTTTAPQIDWNATWSAELSYTAKCSWASTSMQSQMHKHTLTLKISTSGDASKGEVMGGYELTGPKGGATLTLSGDLPVKSHNGGVATRHSLNSPNELTVKLTDVEGANKASGSLEGSWEASGGWKCTVADGKVTISK